MIEREYNFSALVFRLQSNYGGSTVSVESKEITVGPKNFCDRHRLEGKKGMRRSGP